MRSLYGTGEIWFDTVGGLKSLFFSGEGKIWIQTRMPPAFITWADGFRRVKQKKDD